MQVGELYTSEFSLLRFKTEIADQMHLAESPLSHLPLTVTFRTMRSTEMPAGLEDFRAAFLLAARE